MSTVIREEIFAVRKRYPAQADGQRAASGDISDYGNTIARFERFFRPSVFGHLTGRRPFTDPSLNGPVAPLDVKNTLGMWIGLFELENGALHLALMFAIILGVRMMRENRTRQTEQQENNGES